MSALFWLGLGLFFGLGTAVVWMVPVGARLLEERDELLGAIDEWRAASRAWRLAEAEYSLNLTQQQPGETYHRLAAAERTLRRLAHAAETTS